jgi:NADH dehydrogenase [ubiquinone] 1 alpha subcomplex assembly factor 7
MQHVSDEPEQSPEQPKGLAETFKRLIATTGPISVAHYLAEANAYYYGQRDPFGRPGDFVTAPEISQMFGELVGLWLVDVWMRAGKPDKCHYVEFGPGRGTLAQDAMRVANRMGFTPKVHFIEGSALLREAQKLRIPLAQWHDSLESLPQDGPILLVANEFLDALPVRQIVATQQGWRERVVVHNGERFLPVAGPRDMGAVVPAIFTGAEPGTIIETSPAAAAIIYEIGSHLKAQSGTALIIDYGYTQSRTGSSLQAVRAHEKCDPFVDPGLCDLSALVNFEEISRIAAALDLRCSGPVGQGQWLQALGVAHRAAMLVKSNPDKAGETQAALRRLTHEAEMGSLFKVCAISSSGWPDGEGFG